MDHAAENLAENTTSLRTQWTTHLAENTVDHAAENPLGNYYHYLAENTMDHAPR